MITSSGRTKRVCLLRPRLTCSSAPSHNPFQLKLELALCDYLCLDELRYALCCPEPLMASGCRGTARTARLIHQISTGGL